MNKYQREIQGKNKVGQHNTLLVDVYDVLKAFEVTNPATAHAVKKLLASGKRGVKGVEQDLEEAIQSIDRALTLETPPSESGLEVHPGGLGGPKEAFDRAPPTRRRPD